MLKCDIGVVDYVDKDHGNQGFTLENNDSSFQVRQLVLFCFLFFNQDNVYWWWVIACTTGHWQMTRYNVGEHVSRGSNEDKYSIKWFVR